MKNIFLILFAALGSAEAVKVNMTPTDAAAEILKVKEKFQKEQIQAILQDMENQDIYSFRETLVPKRFSALDDD